jgi:hypothetical protein
MPLAVQLANVAEGLTPVAGPTAATGYAVKDILHPNLGTAYLSNAAAASFTFDLDLGAARTIQRVSFFDVRGYTKGPGQISNVQLFYDQHASPSRPTCCSPPSRRTAAGTGRSAGWASRSSTCGSR